MKRGEKKKRSRLRAGEEESKLCSRHQRHQREKKQQIWESLSLPWRGLVGKRAVRGKRGVLQRQLADQKKTQPAISLDVRFGGGCGRRENSAPRRVVAPSRMGHFTLRDGGSDRHTRARTTWPKRMGHEEEGKNRNRCLCVGRSPEPLVERTNFRGLVLGDQNERTMGAKICHMGSGWLRVTLPSRRGGVSTGRPSGEVTSAGGRVLDMIVERGKRT